MKTKKIAPLLVLMLLLSTIAFAQDKKGNDSGKESVLFDVSMHCENCKKKIEKNLPFEKGVTNLKVNLDDKTVWVEFKKDKTDIDKLKQAIEKLGYEATIHSNDKIPEK